MGAKAKHDLAPLVRTAFVNAIDLIERDTGKTFSQMMQDAIEEHGILPVLDRLSKYTVREQAVTGNIKHDHAHRFEIVQAETQRILDSFADIGNATGSEILVQDQSVLPDKSGIQSH